MAKITVAGTELLQSQYTAASGVDSFVDTPTNYGTDTSAGGEVRGNYATMNPLDNGGALTLTQGNLQAYDGNADHNACRATFKFPSTGKWLINAFAYVWTNSAPDYAGVGIYTTTDSGSNWDKRTETLTSVNNDELAGTVVSQACFDITNVSTNKLKVRTIVASSINYTGHTNQNRTGLWAMKLGGT